MRQCTYALLSFTKRIHRKECDLTELVKKVFPVTVMDCPVCVRTIEKELSKLSGVREVAVNYFYRKIFVTYDPSAIGVPELEKRIEDLGYRLAYKDYAGPLKKVLGSLGLKKEEVRFDPVEDRTFEDLVLRSNRPVLLLFTSHDCPTCKALKKSLKEILAGHLETIYIFEMDIMKTRIWEKYNVMNVPTLLVFRDGLEKGRHTGLLSRSDIEGLLKGPNSLDCAARTSPH